MTSPTIRRATPGDLPAIRAILADAYAGPLADIADLPDVTALPDTALDRHAGWLAITETGPAGTALATIDGDRARLVNLAVRPGAGGRGIGRALIDTVIRHATRAGCRHIDLATHTDMRRNIRLYTRLGWVITGQTPRKTTMRRPL